jgi:protein-disulfide isomerase
MGLGWTQLVVAAALVAAAAARSAAVEEPPMSMAPEPAAAAPAGDHDAPVRTRSGKVAPSRDPALPPAYGPSPSKVHVTVFSDFECPVSRRITDATHQIAEEWPGEVRLEFRQHPLAIHPNALNAALASLAAHRQGRFWEMHDLLFANQQALDPASLATYAERAGLDMERYRRDVADPALRERVQAEGALADLLQAKGTPAFVVNGTLSVGWGSWAAFRGQVEQELRAVNALMAKGTKLADVHAFRARQAIKDERAFGAYKAAVVDRPAAKRK